MNGKILFLFALLAFFILLPQHAESAQYDFTNAEQTAKTINATDKGAYRIGLGQQKDKSIDETRNELIKDLNVKIASDVFSERDRQVLYCPKGNYMVVRNRIYVEGKDLDKIKEVRYFLHTSFNQPGGVLGDPNNDFEIWIWTWGGFPIKAAITTKSGQVFDKYFDFSFKSKFEEAQANGIPQVMNCKG